MATVIFGSIGTALGGPVGGAIGSLIGRQFDGALFGSPRREGPRLKELAVTTSTYGQPLPRHFGRVRTAGTVIWATDLVEHSEEQASGKGGPSITRYSYSANFAVALASRPIRSLGRIWADGQLLRGAQGDLKASGILRVHTGAGDQPPDPLILSAEGADMCPAYRGIAYVVFENLDLSGFYNRIPSLTFEVIADEAVLLADIIGNRLENIDAGAALPEMVGYTSEQSPAADLATLRQVLPLEVDAAGTNLLIARSRHQTLVQKLPEPAILVGDDEFGGVSGFSRHRGPMPQAAATVIRYYDPARDFQPGLQRATGHATAGEPYAIDLPVAMDAATAKSMIEQVSRRVDWSRDRISWRTCELDPDVAPGGLVTLPGIDGFWRVMEWEWRDTGVELSLERDLPQSAAYFASSVSDPGRVIQPQDLLLGPTNLVAFELPHDRASGSSDSARIVAAVSSPSAGWTGAALYGDIGDGQLRPLGQSGRRRAVVGTVASRLAPADPRMLDRASQLVVKLIDPTMALVGLPSPSLAAMDNLALVGEELVQFTSATALGDGQWRLHGLVRGLRGTEGAITSHQDNERFVLLGTGVTALGADIINAEWTVAAIGSADLQAVTAPVLLGGIALRPLAPVHPRRIVHEDGSWTLQWTRRARGHWSWLPDVDVPLVEEAERYRVTLGTYESPLDSWTTQDPNLTLPASVVLEILQRSGNPLQVRQLGTHAVSGPLTLLILP